MDSAGDLEVCGRRLHDGLCVHPPRSPAQVGPSLPSLTPMPTRQSGAAAISGHLLPPSHSSATDSQTTGQPGVSCGAMRAMRAASERWRWGDLTFNPMAGARKRSELVLLL